MVTCIKLYDKGTLSDLQKWLEKIFADETCPALNPDVHNIELLLKLKSKNEEAEKNKKEIIKVKKNLTQFYNIKTEELKYLILNCEDVSLSEETTKLVDDLSELAVKMNLEVPDLTSFLLAGGDMKISILKMQEQKLDDSAVLSSLSKRILKTKKNNDALKREIETLTKTVDIQDSNKMKIVDLKTFMKRKSKEYKRDIELYQNYLNERNFRPSLQHSCLVAKNKAVLALEKDVQEVVNKLKSYQTLPPNEYLAKIEVQKKREELDQLEKEMNLLIETWEKHAELK